MADYWYPTAFKKWGNEEREALDRVRDSDRLTMGAEVAAFEQEFADYHGMRYGIMVNSGSSANLIAVAALVHQGFVNPGEKVIVPAIGWSTTYAPLVQYGLELQVVDVDDTWNSPPTRGMSPGNTGLVVSVPILGNPAYLDELEEATSAVGTHLMVDCCESLGALTILGGRAGTQGVVNTFSFFHSHQISAIEGGMILTNDSWLMEVCRMLRSHGWSRDVEEMGKLTFDREYDFRLMGYNVRPTEMHAAVAREQLKKLQGFVAARQSNHSLFRELTMDLPIKHPLQIGQVSPFGLAFELRSSAERNAVVKALRGAGIDCRLPTGGSFTKHAYGEHWRTVKTPRADRIHDTGMFIGNPPWSWESEIRQAVDIIASVIDPPMAA